jgi:hypothetical protein
MTKHLNEEELSHHLITPENLTLEQREHMSQCQKCQAEQEGFFSLLRQAQEILSQDQSKQYACRRRLWTSIDSPKSRCFGLPGKLLMGALCLLAGFLLLPPSPPLPVQDFRPQDQATKESNSLLQFASLLAPDAEVSEPELLTFLQPEDSESGEEAFSDFILFIASPIQEKS